MTTPARDWEPSSLRGYVLGNLVASPFAAVLLLMIGAYWAAPIAVAAFLLAALLWWHG